MKIIEKNMKQAIRNILKLMPDRWYIQYHYYRFFGEWLSFTKINKFSQALNLYKYKFINESFGNYVDKYKVREYVGQRVGDDYLTTIYGVYYHEDEIDLDLLPNSFVLKLNNGSGCNLVVYDKGKLDSLTVKKMCKEWLRSEYYSKGRERQYKRVQQCVIAEELLFGKSGTLADYKLYCFNGKVEFIQVIKGNSQHNYYDKEWNDYGISRREYVKGSPEEKPDELKVIIELAQTLSDKFKFCRVDFYLTKKGVKFGEITFTPGGGMVRFFPSQKDSYLAGLMDVK